MKNAEFYNIDKEPFPRRESFNNAILLLTMIKSEYYYIISFSREKGVINVGFDIENDTYEALVEIISLDFNSSDKEVIIKSKIQNFCSENIAINFNEYNGRFSVVNNEVNYLNKIPKDDLFPLGMKELNKNILLCKNDIINFVQQQYCCAFENN